MKRISILTLYTLLLTGCNSNSNYKFWKISQFNIVESALQDEEEIKLLYSSRGPDNNEKLEYYIHIIAVSQETGDTVNILTPLINGFSMKDKDTVFNYIDANNIASKLILTKQEKFTNIDHLTELSKNLYKKITKVARDPQFDHIADNTYPTVIGMIGTIPK